MYFRVARPRPEEDDSKAELVKKFYCTKCGQFFDDFRKMHDHMFQSTKKHVFRCACCKCIVGSTLLDVILHTKKFCSRDDFRRAEEEEAKAKPNQNRYFCERCGHGFEMLSGLLLHQTEHKNQQVCCSMCDRKARNLLELLIHSRDHMVVGNIELPCKLCPLKLYALTPFKLHYYTVHERLFDIPYKCAFCFVEFVDDEDGFLRHVQSHCVLSTEKASNRPQSDVSKTTCEYCATIFDKPTVLKDHRTSVHKVKPDEKRHCSECKQSILMSALSNHVFGHLKQKVSKLSKNKHPYMNKLATRKKVEVPSNGIAEAVEKNKTAVVEQACISKPKEAAAPVAPRSTKSEIVKPVSGNTAEAPKETPTDAKTANTKLENTTTPLPVSSKTPQSTSYRSTYTSPKPSVAQKAKSPPKAVPPPKPVPPPMYSSGLPLSFSQSSIFNKTQLKCDECDKSFLSIFALNTHKQAHILEAQLKINQSQNKASTLQSSVGNIPKETQRSTSIGGGLGRSSNAGNFVNPTREKPWERSNSSRECAKDGFQRVYSRERSPERGNASRDKPWERSSGNCGYERNSGTGRSKEGASFREYAKDKFQSDHSRERFLEKGDASKDKPWERSRGNVGFERNSDRSRSREGVSAAAAQLVNKESYTGRALSATFQSDYEKYESRPQPSENTQVRYEKTDDRSSYRNSYYGSLQGTSYSVTTYSTRPRSPPLTIHSRARSPSPMREEESYLDNLSRTEIEQDYRSSRGPEVRRQEYAATRRSGSPISGGRRRDHRSPEPRGRYSYGNLRR